MLMMVLVLRIHATSAGAWGNAALMISMGLPAVLTIRLAGRVADGRDSREVITLARVVEVAAALALLAHGGLAWTCAWAAVFQLGYCFASPVWAALVPRIVGDEQVHWVAGQQMLVTGLLAPLGGAAGAWLVGWRGESSALVVVAVLVLVSGGAGLAIRTRRNAAHEDPAEASFDSVWRDPLLSSVLLGSAFMVVVLQGVNVVEVFLARDELDATTTQYGLGEIAGAVGSLAAGLLVGRLATQSARLWAVLFGFAGAGGVCVAMGRAPGYLVYLALVVLVGFCVGVANGALGPLVLLRTPEAHRGRVMAALAGLMSAAGILALVFGGLVGGWLGPRNTFVVSGAAGMVVMAVTALVALPRRG